MFSSLEFSVNPVVSAISFWAWSFRTYPGATGDVTLSNVVSLFTGVHLPYSIVPVTTLILAGRVNVTLSVTSAVDLFPSLSVYSTLLPSSFT